MSLEITITEKYKLTLDAEHNWRVIEFKEPILITGGKLSGQMSKGGWCLVDKFWPRASHAMNYINKCLLVECEDGEITFKEYLKKITEMEQTAFKALDEITRELRQSQTKGGNTNEL